MMMRSNIMRIIALLVCVLAIPVQTTVWGQESVIELLLLKVAELERNQQDCSSYQSKMLLELENVKNKLQQTEKRISELEAVVYDLRSDDYRESLSIAIADDPVDKHASENVTKIIAEEQIIRGTPELKGLDSHKPGILRREVRGIATKQIGFSATIANSITVYPNEIVHFDTVLHNEGNGFNKQTGTFTCPLSGTYFFSVSIMTWHAHTTAIHLIINGVIKVNSHADGGNSWDQGSISSILRCEAGKNVWISVYYGTVIYGDYYTSFSSFLLWGDATGSR